MTPSQKGQRTRTINRARKLLQESIRSIQSIGLILRRGSWGIEHGSTLQLGITHSGTYLEKSDTAATWRCRDKTLCAMSALILVRDQVDDVKNVNRAAAKILGVRALAIGQFIGGFDADRVYQEGVLKDLRHEKPWRALGIEIRNEFFPQYRPK